MEILHQQKECQKSAWNIVFVPCQFRRAFLQGELNLGLLEVLFRFPQNKSQTHHRENVLQVFQQFDFGKNCEHK